MDENEKSVNATLNEERCPHAVAVAVVIDVVVAVDVDVAVAVVIDVVVAVDVDVAVAVEGLRQTHPRIRNLSERQLSEFIASSFELFFYQAWVIYFFAVASNNRSGEVAVKQ